MDSVADLVEPVKLEVRASAGDYKKGKEIVALGGVAMEDFNPLHVTASVTDGGQIYHTELASVPGGLRWTCSCNDQHSFCPHVVATAVTAWEKAPSTHRNPKSTSEA